MAVLDRPSHGAATQKRDTKLGGLLGRVWNIKTFDNTLTRTSDALLRAQQKKERDRSHAEFVAECTLSPMREGVKTVTNVWGNPDVEGAMPRIIVRGKPFQVALDAGMDFEAMYSEVAEAMYGPTIAGQEEERWRFVREITDQDSEGDVGEFTRKSEYVGMRFKLLLEIQNYDPRLNEGGSSTITMTEETWGNLKRGQPISAETNRLQMFEHLELKWTTGVEKDDNVLKEEAILGIWEMSIQKDYRIEMPDSLFDKIVDALSNKYTDKIRSVAAAVTWCLSVSSQSRTDLMNVGKSEEEDEEEVEEGTPGAHPFMRYLIEMLKTSITREPAEFGGEDEAYTCEVRDEFYDRSLGTLGIMFVDKRARAQYIELDPGLEMLLGACAAPMEDPPFPVDPPSEAELAAMKSDKQRAKAINKYKHAVHAYRCERSHRRLSAGETLASIMLRDYDARGSLVKSGGYGSLSSLLESDNAAIRLAASAAMGIFAKDPASQEQVAQEKNLSETIDSLTRTLKTSLTELVGPAPPTVTELYEAEKAAKAAALKAEEEAEAKAAAIAAAKARAEALGEEWVEPESEEETPDAGGTVKRVMSTVSVAELEQIQEESAALKASTIPLMAATIENCITALWGLVRATLANTESLSDEAMLRLISFCRRAHDGVQNDAITENAVFTAIGIIATLCEDRSHCERLMLLGARPETPPPFTAEEIAEFELAEFKARREGKKFVRPVREKLPWDYTHSVIECIKHWLTVAPYDEGRTRTMAAVCAGLILEYMFADAPKEGDATLDGPYRGMLMRDTELVDKLIESAKAGANHKWFHKPLWEATAAALMYLATPYEAAFTPKQLENIVSLINMVIERYPSETYATMKYLACTIWCVARSPSGRGNLIKYAPNCIPYLIEMGNVCVKAVSISGKVELGIESEEERLIEASDAGEDSFLKPNHPRIRAKALQFTIASLWLMLYSENDPPVHHGEVYLEKDGALLTIPRVETPSLEDMDVVDEFGGIKPGMPELEEDRLAAAAKVKAAEAEVYVTKMQLVMDAGDEPETPVEQATTAFYEATKAAEEAAAAALAAHAARAENIAASRKNIMNFLLTAIRLPAIRLTEKSRKIAVAASWSICYRSAAARREYISAGLFDALESCACDGGENTTVRCTTFAAAAMESLLAFHDVSTAVGGPARMEKIGIHMVTSPLLGEQERGARILAFMTSDSDSNSIKASLVRKSVLPNLLKLLCPIEVKEEVELEEEAAAAAAAEAVREAEEMLSKTQAALDAGEEPEYDLDDTEDLLRKARKTSEAAAAVAQEARDDYERHIAESGEEHVSHDTEMKRCAELFAAAALLNLSSLPAAQISLARHGIYRLLKTNASGMVNRRHVAIGEGVVKGGDLIAGTIQNIASNAENRTIFYKLELRAKALERVLHNKKEVRHLNRHIEVAGRIVGESYEKAKDLGVSYESSSRRRKGHVPAKGDETAVVEEISREDPESTPALKLPSLLEDVLAQKNEKKVDIASFAKKDGLGTFEVNTSATQASAESFLAQDAETVEKKSQFAEDDWLSSIANADDDTFAEGLALLTHSMRQPLWNLWARPEERRDDLVSDPEMYGASALTRVHLVPLQRGTPEGEQRWRPPIRKYVQTRRQPARQNGDLTSDMNKMSLSGTLPPVGQDGEAYIAETTTRLLSTTRPGSVQERLRAKAAEIAEAVALGGPESCGGIGSEDGLKGSSKAPNALPVMEIVPDDVEDGLEIEHDTADGAGEYGPLKVVLDPAGSRNCVNFVSGFDKAPDPAKRNAKLVMFEHVSGAKVYEELFPVYSLPNCKKAFYYHTGNNLVPEVPIRPDELPYRPGTLELTYELRLPQTDMLHEVARPNPNLGDDKPYKPVPRLCPLPDRHFLEVNEPESLDEESFGNLVIPPLEFKIVEDVIYKTTEESFTVAAKWVEPWSIENSVFAPRKKFSDARDFFDRTPLFDKMFDRDWHHALKKKQFVRFLTKSGGDDESPDDKLKLICSALKNYYFETEKLYRYYGVTGTGDSMTMQLNEWIMCATDCQLPDPESKLCTSSHLGTMFKVVNFEQESEGKEMEMIAKLNQDNALTRFEFIEILCRVADAKYVQVGTCASLAEAISVMYEMCIMPNLNPEVQMGTYDFRVNRLYTEAVDDVFRGVFTDEEKFGEGNFRTYKSGTTYAVLEALYYAYCMPVGGTKASQRKSMQMDQFIEVLFPLNLMRDEESDFSLREAQLCFLYSQMRVIRQFVDAEKYESLTFVDFLEALARVSECIPIPPLADIKSRGYKSALDWLSKTSQVDARNDANTEKLTLLSRPSREFTAKKTRPLNQKLAEFLDFLFRCVAVRVCKIEEDEYTEAKCVKLFKSLRAAREHGGQARG